MNKTLKWLIISIAGLLILLLILNKSGVLHTTDVIEVSTEKVARRTIVETVNANGKIHPETEIKIFSDMPGEVKELYVKEGDSVKKGQILARINNHDALSPIDGTVLLINVKRGERVTGNSMMAANEIIRLADLSKMEVRVDVGENDIVKVNVNDTATIYVDAYNKRKFKAIVTQIAGTSNGGTSFPATGSAADITNYKVYLRLLPGSYSDLMDSLKPNSFPFRPGMSAIAEIETKTHENRLAVPIIAVTTRDRTDSTNSKQYTAEEEKNVKGNEPIDMDELEEVVFIVQNDRTVRKTRVKTDIQDINYIEVVSGVKEGDEVVTGPYDVISKTLNNKDKVKVVSRSELFDKKK